MPPRRQNRNQRAEEPVNNVGRQPDPMQNFANMIAQAMRNVMPAAGNQPDNRLANFKDFKTVGPPEFRGTTDPIEAQIWVKEIEKAFVIARVAEEQKTAFATYMMKGEANFWWEANQARAGEGVIAWTRFKTLFFENYFSSSMQARMEVKFLELKQDNMTVAEYAARFNELARFAPHQVDTETRKARRFELGLKPWLYNKVAVLRINTFAELLETAIIAEGASEAMSLYNKEKKNKGKVEGAVKAEASSWSKNGKRKGDNFGTIQVKQEGAKKQLVQCGNCGKNHSGECLKGRFVCYKCGQEGHISPNCPNPRMSSGCFMCGSAEHKVKDCPKRRIESGSVNVGKNSGTLAITGPASTYKPTKATARVFNMTVQDTAAAGDGSPGMDPINDLHIYDRFVCSPFSLSLVC